MPRNIEEALNDENWNLAVQEEMRALRINNTWGMVNLPVGKNVVGVNGCSPLNLKPMAQLKDIRPDLWLEDSRRHMGWITMRRLH